MVDTGYPLLTKTNWLTVFWAIIVVHCQNNDTHKYLTYSIEQSSPWEANRFSASQDFPALYAHEGSLPHSQVPTTCLYREPHRLHPTSWRSSLILSSHLRLGLPNGLFPSGFPTKTLYTPLLCPIRATCPVHLILLDLITRTILGEGYRSLSSSLCSFIHSLVTSSLLGPNILLRSLLSNTLGLRSSLNGIVLHILSFKFFG